MTTEIHVLTGPESSGKTTLANQLCEAWEAPLVTEASREYLKGKSRYQQRDLLEIAKRQLQQEQTAISHSPRKIICDTDLLVIMIWSEVKYGHCDPWIVASFAESIQQKTSTRFYYLCDSKIPWQADPLRENPDNRDELFELYLLKLKEYKLDYCIVKGTPQARLQQALNTSSS